MSQNNIDNSITYDYNALIEFGGEPIEIYVPKPRITHFTRKTPYESKKTKKNQKKLYSELKKICKKTMSEISSMFGCSVDLEYFDFQKAILAVYSFEEDENEDFCLEPLMLIQLLFDLTDPHKIQLTTEFLSQERRKKILENDIKDIRARTVFTTENGEQFRYDEDGNRIEI